MEVVMRTCSTGKFLLKSGSLVDALKMSKKPEDACAPTPKSSVVLAFAHAFASFAAGVAMVKSAEALRSTNTLAEGPSIKVCNVMINRGMR